MLRGARRRLLPASPQGISLRRKSCAVSETPHYSPTDVEARWSGEKWAWSQSSGPKSYILSMFPYPSGRLHMGHVRVYTISDTLARYRRLLGEEVLHPMGWDAFGLPAENAAIERGIDPASWTVQNIGVMRGQLDRMGCHFDWDREVTTCSPDYYRWTQWLFLQLYHRGLAYKKKAVVNWDPVDGTVLANEQVDSDGRSWRSGAIVEKRLLDQWFFKITHYADALLEGLKDLDWPDAVKNTQAQWIGRSRGAYFDFHLSAEGQSVRVFTTLQHTLYGVTFLAISPHHPLVKTLSASVQETVSGWSSDDSTAKGVFTGLTAVHPLTHQSLPVWVADYVISEYGTGAVMGVPAHDERDHLFATHHTLPILPVMQDGLIVNSQHLNGLSTQAAAEAVLEQAVTMGTGGTMTTYKLRDWLISRQRYWGAPIPILYCDKCGIVPVSEDKLPVVLPTSVQFTGRGPSPLATNAEWGRGCCGKRHCRARKETDTMDTFVDSSWYFLRYTSPHHSNQAFTKQGADSWLPVDVYVGGIEHAHLHLLYARFITHVLHDIGLLATKEPFQKLIAQGMVQGLTYREEVSGRYLQPEEDKNGRGISVSWEKMSKSKYNGVDPEVIVQRYGADAVRLFMLFKAPPELSMQWEDDAIQGVSRWLSRLWRMTHSHIRAVRGGVAHEDQHRDKIVSATHKAIKQVTGAMEGRYSLNTALPELMILSNVLRDHTPSRHTLPYHEALTTLVLLLSPMAPHVSCSLWEGLSMARLTYTQAQPIKGGVFEQSWPEWNKDLLDLSTSRAIVLQVNGRKKGVVEVSVSVAEDYEQLKATILTHALDTGLITSHDNIVIASNGLLVNIVSSS